MRTLCIALSAALLLSGCSTVRTVRPATQPLSPAFGGARPGDRVSLVLVDGLHASVVVRTIEGDTLVARTGEHYQKNQIKELSLKVRSPGRTAVLVISLAAGALAFAVLLAYGAGMGSLAGGL